MGRKPCASWYVKVQTALTVYLAQARQLAIQRNNGTLFDRARAWALVFRLVRQAGDVWIAWPARIAALRAAQEKQTGKSVMIDATTLQRVLDAHVRTQLETMADLRDSIGCAQYRKRP